MVDATPVTAVPRSGPAPAPVPPGRDTAPVPPGRDTAPVPPGRDTALASGGVLVLAGTPIGDHRQASPALTSALLGADLIAAEDTRRLRSLCRRLALPLTAPVVSYFEGNEAARTVELTAALRQGRRIVLVSDAGMPVISDPGARLVRAALEAGARVTAVPGPSAVLTAVAVSGLASDRFCFEGFPPRKAGPRAARLRQLAGEERTLVFFEAPHRLARFLAAACDAFGADRPGAICRELTKTHEEVVRGSLADLATWAAGEVRGEITVVIAGAGSDRGAGRGQGDGGAVGLVEQTALAHAVGLAHGVELTHEAELVAEAEALATAGAKPSAAVAEVAARHGVDRKALYGALTRSRKAQRTA